MEKFHPELGGEVMGHPYFNSLHPGRSSPESLDFIHQAVLLSYLALVLVLLPFNDLEGCWGYQAVVEKW